MKPTVIVSALLTVLGLGGVWMILSEDESNTHVENLVETPPTIADSSSSASTELVRPNEIIPSPDATSTNTEHLSQMIESPTDSQNGEDQDLLGEMATMMQEANLSLQADAGLSDHNLMVLNSLATRLVDFKQSYTKDLPWDEVTADWPSHLIDSLHNIVAAQEAEIDFLSHNQEAFRRNPEAFQDSLLKQQQQILGSELFEKLYSSDSMVISDHGLSGTYTSPEDTQTQDQESKEHQERLELLEQWQNNQLTEQALAEALANSLSMQEIEQLVDMGTHHEEWLGQLSGFLNEYRYIEQAGITGEDELQARQELIERHFADENRQVVDQFLFGAKTSL